jgi:flagellar biosynthesis/type III secretory pathway chaperone
VEQTLDALCGHFDRELERQEIVLALVQAQRLAITAGDSEVLEARTQSLQHVIREAVDAESDRLALLQDTVAHFRLPVERQTLTHLIGEVPEPWKRRLQEFQTDLKQTLYQIRDVERGNARLLRRSMRRLNGTLRILGDSFKPSDSYTASGSERGARPRGPLVMDQRG